MESVVKSKVEGIHQDSKTSRFMQCQDLGRLWAIFLLIALDQMDISNPTKPQYPEDAPKLKSHSTQRWLAHTKYHYSSLCQLKFDYKFPDAYSATEKPYVLRWQNPIETVPRANFTKNITNSTFRETNFATHSLANRVRLLAFTYKDFNINDMTQVKTPQYQFHWRRSHRNLINITVRAVQSALSILAGQISRLKTLRLRYLLLSPRDKSLASI